MRDVYAEATEWLKDYVKSDEFHNKVEKMKADIREELQAKEKAWEAHKQAVLTKHGELAGNLILLQELNEELNKNPEKKPARKSRKKRTYKPQELLSL